MRYFFDQALERAKELDAYRVKSGKIVGPLHGLPLSLKYQFHVKGVDTAIGYVGWIGSNMGIKERCRICHGASLALAGRIDGISDDIRCFIHSIPPHIAIHGKVPHWVTRWQTWCIPLWRFGQRFPPEVETLD